MDIGKSHHRRGGNQKHRKLIDEVTDGRTGRLTADVETGRKITLLDIQVSAEETNLILFGFKVLVLMIQENKIEHDDAASDEVDLVRPSIAHIFFFDSPIEPTRENVVDD